MHPPTITETGALTKLTSRVVIPSSFDAEFKGPPKVTLKVVVRHGRPLVRAFNVSCTKGGLHTRDTSLPLLSKLLPAAVAAAVRTLIAGDTSKGQGKLVKGSLAGVVGKVGTISVTARLSKDLQAYKSAAAVARRGRPPLEHSRKVLQSIADTYMSNGGSIAAVMSDHWLSRSTAKRRIDAAIEAGIIERSH